MSGRWWLCVVVRHLFQCLIVSRWPNKTGVQLVSVCLTISIPCLTIVVSLWTTGCCTWCHDAGDILSARHGKPAELTSRKPEGEESSGVIVLSEAECPACSPSPPSPGTDIVNIFCFYPGFTRVLYSYFKILGRECFSVPSVICILYVILTNVFACSNYLWTFYTKICFALMFGPEVSCWSSFVSFILSAVLFCFVFPAGYMCLWPAELTEELSVNTVSGTTLVKYGLRSEPLCTYSKQTGQLIWCTPGFSCLTLAALSSFNLSFRSILS